MSEVEKRLGEIRAISFCAQHPNDSNQSTRSQTDVIRDLSFWYIPDAEGTLEALGSNVKSSMYSLEVADAIDHTMFCVKQVSASHSQRILRTLL